MPDDKKKTKPVSTPTLNTAGTTGTIAMQFFDESAGFLSLGSAQVRVRELCKEQPEPCWGPVTLNTNPTTNVTTSEPFNVPTNEMLLIEAQGMIDEDGGGDGTKANFIPAVCRLDCGQAKTLVMKRRPDSVASQQTDTVTLAVKAHRCESKEGHREQTGGAKITWATATAAPAESNRPRQGEVVNQAKPMSIRATIIDDAAFLTLKKGGYYIDGALGEDCATTCPSFPFYYCVDRDEEISICAVPPERMLTLVFRDRCGNAVAQPEVFWEQRGTTPKSLPESTGGGTFTLKGVSAGRVRFISTTGRCAPDGLDVREEDWKRAEVITYQDVSLPASAKGMDKILLDMGREIRKEERAQFRVLNLERELIETIEAEDGRAVYPAEQDLPLLIQAVVGGSVIGEQVHQPKRLGTGRA
jgi:hypothetical protein